MLVVTGAPGHLGNNLVRLLLQGGNRVRCMVLRGESLISLEGLDVEIVEGDVRDPASLDCAFAGADVVYHLASVISLTPRHLDLLEQVNVRGARNVAEACLRNGVRRLVYTSSIHALVEPPRGMAIDESMPCDPSRIKMAYSRSKAEGTLEVMDVARQGMDVVVLYPTGIVGPFDFKPSEMGQVVLDYVRGKIPARIAGGYDFVDVRDVAMGHILAAEKGDPGEGYILSGEWISVDDIMAELSQVARVPVPRMRLPLALARVAASVSTMLSAVFRMRSLLNTDSLDTLTSNSLVCSAKARRDLGYGARPVRESLRDAVRWFRQAGMLPA
jgi:dihydroflavonol-4-reductase